ncbi:MAG: hypothetical protein J6W51_02810 [Fibrobacter sp.]|nr:hypothetical protein [Fibrobacter sp.]
MVRIIRHRHRRHAVVTTEDGDNCVPRTRVNKAFAVMPALVPASVVLDTTDPATVCGVTIAYRECGVTCVCCHAGHCAGIGCFDGSVQLTPQRCAG